MLETCPDTILTHIKDDLKDRIKNKNFSVTDMGVLRYFDCDMEISVQLQCS